MKKLNLGIFENVSAEGSLKFINDLNKCSLGHDKVVNQIRNYTKDIPEAPNLTEIQHHLDFSNEASFKKPGLS